MRSDSLTIAAAVCVYNDTRLLRALNSIIEQTEAVNELIIVNDGSDEFVDDTIQKFISESDLHETDISVQYFKLEKNKGIGTARRLAFQNTRCKFIAFLDADDYWHSRKIELSKRLIIEHDARIVCHDTDLHEQCRDEVNIDKYKKISKFSVVYSSLPQTSGIVFDRSYFVNFLPIRHCEDWIFFYCYAIYGDKDIVYLQQPLSFCDRLQRSEGGLSGNRKKMRISQIRFLTFILKNLIIISILTCSRLIALPLLMIRDKIK